MLFVLAINVNVAMAKIAHSSLARSLVLVLILVKASHHMDFSSDKNMGLIFVCWMDKLLMHLTQSMVVL